MTRGPTKGPRGQGDKGPISARRTAAWPGQVWEVMSVLCVMCDERVGGGAVSVLLLVAS